MSAAEVLMIIQGSRLALQLAAEMWAKLAAKGELTDEQHAAFAREMELAFQADYWKPKV